LTILATSDKESDLKADETIADSDASTLELITKQITLFALAVMFVGIVNLETYYAIFGIQYQFLNLPNAHFIYRGLTALIHTWYLVLPYAAAAVLLSVPQMGFRRASVVRVRLATFFVIFGLLALCYPLARQAAIRDALQDLTASKSTLPRVKGIFTKNNDGLLDKNADYRLLSLNEGGAVYFKAQQDPQLIAINVHFITKETYDEILVQTRP